MLKKKKAKGGHMQHGHTQWRVPIAPVAAKPAKKPKEEPKPAVGTSSLCASHSPALSNPSVPAVQGAPLGKRPAARADSEPLKKQKKKVPKTNGAPAKSESASSRPATGYTAAPIAPAAPAAQSPLAATAAATAAAVHFAAYFAAYFAIYFATYFATYFDAYFAATYFAAFVSKNRRQINR